MFPMQNILGYINIAPTRPKNAWWNISLRPKPGFGIDTQKNTVNQPERRAMGKFTSPDMDIIGIDMLSNVLEIYVVLYAFQWKRNI